jgi:hypothetical protein
VRGEELPEEEWYCNAPTFWEPTEGVVEERLEERGEEDLGPTGIRGGSDVITWLLWSQVS